LGIGLRQVLISYCNKRSDFDVLKNIAVEGDKIEDAGLEGRIRSMEAVWFRC
jgi:hypothetical protein